MLSVILLLAVFNINLAQASLPMALSPEQVPFFKTPESQFPSGYVSLDSLKKQILIQRPTAEKFYKWHNQLFKLDDLRPVRPAHLSKKVIDPTTRETLEVVQTTVQNLFVKNPKYPTKNSFRIDEVLADHRDLGYFLALKDLSLKNEPTEKSLTKTTIPLGTRLTAETYKNGFAQIKYKSLVGYVSLSEMISKFDLATMIYAESKWHFVKKREFDFIITSENEKIHLSQISGVVTPEHRGLIASTNQKIPLWSQVEITSTTSAQWVQSYLKGQGAIWWKLENSQTTPEGTLTIDELLKKKIASVSFHPKNPLKGILSAQGVYMTEDGYFWKRLPQFGDFNGPVHYFNDLLVFVGNFRSVDGGAHFDNYIHIDKLTLAIEKQLGFQPKKLQVKKIQTEAPFKIKIQIETGFRTLQMESPLFSQDWKLTKTL